MEGERRSKRQRQKAVPVLSQRERAVAAAKDVILEEGTSIRAAAARHEVENPTLVHYYVKLWRGTEMETAFRTAGAETAEASQEPSLPDAAGSASCTVTSSSSGACPTSSSSSSGLSVDDIDRLDRMPAYKVQREMIKEAVELHKGGKTLRQAASIVNDKYNCMSRKVTTSHMSVKRFSAEGYKPQPPGKTGYLPEEFTEKVYMIGCWLFVRSSSPCSRTR
ncbi:hypothetical protein AB1Y20_006405 [Prymnesium parvum]|uniref:HTH psq-type domain-containing protein n=1 Tax=Prymnesium parvum TaxID=97485 RepID=A0AB34J4Z8_PRYPA